MADEVSLRREGYVCNPIAENVDQPRRQAGNAAVSRDHQSSTILKGILSSPTTFRCIVVALIAGFSCIALWRYRNGIEKFLKQKEEVKTLLQEVQQLKIGTPKYETLTGLLDQAIKAQEEQLKHLVKLPEELQMKVGSFVMFCMTCAFLWQMI